MQKNRIPYLAVLVLQLAFLPINNAMAAEEYMYRASTEVKSEMSDITIGAQSGAFIFDQNIEVPAGRNGMQPDLKLQYNNQDEDQSNIAGYSWSFSIPSIQRLSKTGVDKMYDANYFSSSLSGELLPTGVANQYGPKVETGSFLNYTFNNNKWIVIDKTGTTYTFGNDVSARQDDVNNSAHAYKWMLSEIRDANDNFVKYEYFKDNGQIYPARVVYTGHGTINGIYEVVFNREARIDTSVMYNSGFKIKTQYRISDITIKTNNVWTKKYDLTYIAGDNGKRSLLESITESGNKDGAVLTLPATTFTYQTKEKGFTYDGEWGPKWNHIVDYSTGQNCTNGTLADKRILDLNGDGLMDMTMAGQPNWCIGQMESAVNTGNKSFNGGPILPEKVISTSGRDNAVRFDDLNGDGMMDAVQSKHISGVYAPFPTPPGSIYLSRGFGQGYDYYSTTTIPVFFIDEEYNYNYTRAGDMATAMGDINGDGLADLLQNNGAGNKIYLNKGNGINWEEMGAEYNVPMALDSFLNQSAETAIFDVNGDGLQDFVSASHPGIDVEGVGAQIYPSLWACLNIDGGKHYDCSYGIDIPGPPSGYQILSDHYDNGGRFLDVNGDGLVDFVRSNLERNGVLYNGIYINKGDGTGWTYDTAYTAVQMSFVYDAGGGTWVGNGIRAVDMNSDGLTDFMNIHPGGSVYLNNGKKPDMLVRVDHSKGATTEVTYKTAQMFRKADGSQANPKLPFVIHVADKVTTDDGLGNKATTSYQYEGGKYYFNNYLDKRFAGFGIVAKTDALGNVTKQYFHQGDGTDMSLGERADHPAKINMMYREDLLDSNGNIQTKTMNKIEVVGLGNNRNFVFNSETVKKSYDSTGAQKDVAESFEYDPSVVTPPSSTQKSIDLENTLNQYLSITDANQTGLDITGNITIEAWIKAETWPTTNAYHYVIVEKSSNDPAQYRFRLRYDGKLTFGFSSDLTHNTEAVSNSALEYLNTWYHVVASVNPSSAQVTFYINGQQSTTSYSTQAATFIQNGVGEFHVGSKTHEASGFFDGQIDDVRVWNTARTAQEISENYQNELTGNEPNLVGYWKFNNDLIDVTTNHNDLTNNGGAVFADGWINPSQSATNFNGNLIKKTEWGEVLAQADGTFIDVGADSRVYNYSYVTNGANIIGLPSRETVTDQIGNKIREIISYYDDLPFGEVSTGNNTKNENWIVDIQYATARKVYNAFGLPTQIYDANNNSTTMVYEFNNLYPETVTNALNQSTQYQYDYSAGKPKRTVDTNNNVTETSFDPLNRVSQERITDTTNPTNMIVAAEYFYDDASMPKSVQTKKYFDDMNTVDAYSYINGLGKTIQERTEAENSFSVKDFVYNKLGLVQKESLAYFSAGSAQTTPTTDNSLYTNYTYDALQRVKTITNAVGTTLNNYFNWKVSTTDAKGNIKDYYNDAYGRLVQVTEHNTGENYNTYYEYDGNSNLTKITDALGNVRNFGYDGLGRRKTAEDLHAQSDTTFGVWNYVYDNNGNLTSQTDLKNQTTAYIYDVLNRKTSEDSDTQTGIEVSYIYDTGCQNSIGRLCSVTNSNVATNYNYNILGQVTNETKNIDSVNYTTQYSYDRAGNVISTIYPDNSEVKNQYNSAGQLENVIRKESTDSAFVNVVNDFDYSPLGQITYQEDANGTATTNTYNQNELYRLQNKKTMADVKVLQDITYTYDQVGNIMQMIDASELSTAKTSDYTYDDLYRLTGANITGTATGTEGYYETYRYDSIGNILNKTMSTATSTPPVIPPYTLKSLDLESSSNQYLSISDAYQTGLEPAEDITIEAWIKLEQLPSIATSQFVIVSKDNTTFAYRFSITQQNKLYMGYSSDGVTVFTDVTSNDPAFSSGDIGVWIHVKATCDGSTKDCLLYKNGSEIASTPILSGGGATSIVNSFDFFAIGAKPNGTLFFDGMIDDVRIYNAVVNDDYQAELTGNETNLMGYWKLDGNANDLTGHNNLIDNGLITYSTDSSPVSIGILGASKMMMETSETLLANTFGSTDYIYAGTDFTNPHAVTMAGNKTFTYDQSGNLTSDGTWTNIWDYDNRLMSSIGVISNQTPTSCALPWSVVDATIAHFTMNDNALSNVVTNNISSANGTFYDPTGSSNTSAHSVPGKINTALTFDGVNDYINAGNSSNTGLNDFSISFWAKFVDTTTVQSVIAKYSGASYASNSAGKGWEVLYRPDQVGKPIQFRFNDGTSTGKTLSVPNINLTDAFHNIIVTADKDGLATIYVDSVPVGMMSMTGEPGTFDNTGILYIGRQSGTGIKGFVKGNIDDVRIMNRKLTLIEIQSIFNKINGTEEDSGCFGQTEEPLVCPARGAISWNLDSATLAHFKMNDNTNSSIVAGKTGTFDGTLFDPTGNRNTSAHSVPGKTNTALTFDGVNDYVNFGDNADTGLSDFSISFWAKFGAGTKVQTVIAKYSGSSYANNSAGKGWEVLYRPDLVGKPIQFRFNDGTSTGKTLSVPNINLTDTFHNIVITADKDGFVTMYIDNSPVGILTMTGEPGTFDNTGNLSIGRQSGTGTGAYLSGVIDDVRITNRLLTLTEIGAMYNDNIGTEEEVSCWGVASDTITTINYTYDQSGQRVKKTIGNKIYIYPNKLYNIEDGKIKKYIFAGDNNVATIDDGKTIYHHTDHLSGSSVETDKDSLVVEEIDYYPFGSIRTDNKTTTYENDKKFTGYELDENDLYYAGQRYYNSDIGRFVSVDPAHRDIGDSSFKQKYNRSLKVHLSNPQSLNSYTYVNNNPLKYTDPEGEIIPIMAIAAFAGGGAIVSSGFMMISDIFTDANYTRADYAGTVVSGAISGLAFMVAPGAGLALSSAIGASSNAVGNLTKQGINMSTGKQQTFDGADLGRDAFGGLVSGGIASKIPVKIPGITKGINSFEAVSKQLMTGFSSGKVNSMSAKSMSKMFVYSGVNQLVDSGTQQFMGLIGNNKSNNLNGSSGRNMCSQQLLKPAN